MSTCTLNEYEWTNECKFYLNVGCLVYLHVWCMLILSNDCQCQQSLTNHCCGDYWNMLERVGWWNKSSIRAACRAVSGSTCRTKNSIVESFRNSFRRLVKISHPNFYAFLGYLQEVSMSNMADVQRLNRWGQIRRQKKKANLMNDKRIRNNVTRYSSGSCTITVFVFR